MRNLAKVTSTIGKRLNSETGASSSMYGGTGEENKSTQGGSNYQHQLPQHAAMMGRPSQFNENSRGDFNYQGHQHILSQTIQHDADGIVNRAAKSASRYGRGGSRYTAATNKSKTNNVFQGAEDAATRIRHYRKLQKLKAQSGLNSTLQLQEKLSLLSYHPPGAHVEGRIRCSTRNQIYRPSNNNTTARLLLNQ